MPPLWITLPAALMGIVMGYLILRGLGRFVIRGEHRPPVKGSPARAASAKVSDGCGKRAHGGTENP
jgi:hypothetical protein